MKQKKPTKAEYQAALKAILALKDRQFATGRFVKQNQTPIKREVK